MKTFFRVSLYVITMLAACTPLSLLRATNSPKPVLPTRANPPLALTATLRPPTLTPLPTLLADQAKARVFELLNTNNGCKLPCFWGITSGHTSWSDAKSFLEAFSSRDSMSYFPQSTNFFSNFHFVVSSENAIGLTLKLFVSNDSVRTIQVSDFDTPSYHLTEFLIKNGEPDQVWLLTYSQVSYGGGDVVPFLVYLFYKDAQMIVAYGYGQGTVKGEQITGCIEGSPSLYIWSLDKSLMFQEAGQLGGYLQPNDKFLEISDATRGTLNTEKFYETFKVPGVESCFQTPKNLWPGN